MLLLIFSFTTFYNVKTLCNNIIALYASFNYPKHIVYCISNSCLSRTFFSMLQNENFVLGKVCLGSKDKRGYQSVNLPSRNVNTIIPKYVVYNHV